MRRSICIIACLVVAACSGKPLVGPSDAPAAVVSTSAVEANSIADAGRNCHPPAQSSISYDPVEGGKVTITNASDCVNDFTFVVWRLIDIAHPENQQYIASSQATLQPGETRVLTVGFDDPCGRTYQRDVFFGAVKKAPYSLSDFSNWDPNSQTQRLYPSPFGYFKSLACDAPPPPPPPPPPPTCQDTFHPTSVQSCGCAEQTGQQTVFTDTHLLSGIDAKSDVSGSGMWKLTLYATSSASEYPDDPDYLKDTDIIQVGCGGHATLKVSYNWFLHPSRYWWVRVFRNNILVYTSPKVSKF